MIVVWWKIILVYFSPLALNLHFPIGFQLDKNLKYLFEIMQLLKIEAVARACNFIKKETLRHVFSYEYSKISKNTFFTEHLQRLFL